MTLATVLAAFPAGRSTPPLWAALPAVSAGSVFTFDRLGYPGAEGRARFATELAAAFAAAG